jgi:replication factor C subunit 3/5
MSNPEQRLWVEKYRPLTIADATASALHKETFEMIHKLA